MEWSLYDNSDECAVPWVVEPGGRDAEYDPGSLSFTPPASMVTNLASSTSCVLDDYFFYKPSIRPIVPVAPIMIDQQGISSDAAQDPSVGENDGDRSKVDQATNYDGLRSQHLLFTRASEQLFTKKQGGGDLSSGMHREN